jgi:hypothetical protein
MGVLLALFLLAGKVDELARFSLNQGRCMLKTTEKHTIHKNFSPFSQTEL